MRTIIIGAVALGASTAARLKRLDPNHEIILLEKGNYASFANCGLPYFVGNEIEQQSSLLVVEPCVFTKRFQIDLRVNSEVIRIDPNNNKVLVKDHKTNEEYILNYDNLVLAMGADAIKPRIEGIDNPNVFFLKTVDDAVALKERIKTAETVAVIGGGFIGLEAMENLVLAGKKVHLIEGRPTVSNLDYDMALIAQKIIKEHGVTLHTSTMLQGIEERKDGKLVLKTDKGEVIADAVVMSIGVRPNSLLAKEAGIELDPTGTIKVDEYLRTNFKNVYAGGDLVANYEAITNHQVYVPLANYANKHGRIIANNIYGIPSKRQKISMASVFKLFDYTVSSVGLGHAMLEKFNIPHEEIHSKPYSHATYYPGATDIYCKVNYSKDGKIYGAQMIGQNLVEKRIDVLSALLLNGCTYKDLMEVESTYAPPFGSAKDPLNFLGFMIDNVLNRGIKTISPLELDKIKDDIFLVDVRRKEEYELGHIPNAINIPLVELRNRLDELPKDKTIYLHCNVGVTSYNAICILKDLGYDCVNVAGGYSVWHMMCE